MKRMNYNDYDDDDDNDNNNDNDNDTTMSSSRGKRSRQSSRRSNNSPLSPLPPPPSTPLLLSHPPSCRNKPRAAHPFQWAAYREKSRESSRANCWAAWSRDEERDRPECGPRRLKGKLKGKLQAYAGEIGGYQSRVPSKESDELDTVRLTICFADTRSAEMCARELYDNRRLARCAIENWMKDCCSLCKIHYAGQQDNLEVREEPDSRLPSLQVSLAFALSQKASSPPAGSWLSRQQESDSPLVLVPEPEEYDGWGLGARRKDKRKPRSADQSSVIAMLKSLRTVLLHVFGGSTDVSFGSVEELGTARPAWPKGLENWCCIACGDVLGDVELQPEDELRNGVCLFAKGCRRALNYVRTSPDDFAPAPFLFRIALRADLFDFVDDQGAEGSSEEGREWKQRAVDELIATVERSTAGLSFDTKFYVFVNEQGRQKERGVVMQCNLLQPIDPKKFVSTVKYIRSVAECHAYYTKQALHNMSRSCVSSVLPWIPTSLESVDEKTRKGWVDAKDYIRNR